MLRTTPLEAGNRCRSGQATKLMQETEPTDNPLTNSYDHYRLIILISAARSQVIICTDQERSVTHNHYQSTSLQIGQQDGRDYYIASYTHSIVLQLLSHVCSLHSITFHSVYQLVPRRVDRYLLTSPSTGCRHRYTKRQNFFTPFTLFYLFLPLFTPLLPLLSFSCGENFNLQNSGIYESFSAQIFHVICFFLVAVAPICGNILHHSALFGFLYH